MSPPIASLNRSRKVAKMLTEIAKFSLASKIFQPVVRRPWNTGPSKELLSPSYQFMLDSAMMEPGGHGLFHLLPVGLRSLEKLIKFVDNSMKNFGAQKVQMSSLTQISLWERSGRWETSKNDLFRLQDRTKTEFCLGPTHEEVITEILARQSNFGITRFPLFLYQITSKFRDEMNPRFGLLRSREFLMKDMYSFDAGFDAAKRSYDLVSNAYDELFRKLGLKTLKVEATVGNIGGSKSDEYHLPNPAGQDFIRYCYECHKGHNTELRKDDRCVGCGKEMEKIRSIEVAHTFLLGDKYSAIFNLQWIDQNGARQPVQMGCFGIGVTRLLAAAVDVSLDRNGNLRLPTAIAPYVCCSIIPPKAGSKEEHVCWPLSQTIAAAFVENFAFQGSELTGTDILLDDRCDMTIGRRLLDAKKLGIPVIIVIGKSAMEDVQRFEVHDLTATDQQMLLTHEELFAFLRNKFMYCNNA